MSGRLSLLSKTFPEAWSVNGREEECAASFLNQRGIRIISPLAAIAGFGVGLIEASSLRFVLPLLPKRSSA